MRDIVYGSSHNNIFSPTAIPSSKDQGNIKYTNGQILTPTKKMKTSSAMNTSAISQLSRSTVSSSSSTASSTITTATPNGITLRTVIDTKGRIAYEV